MFCVWDSIIQHPLYYRHNVVFFQFNQALDWNEWCRLIKFDGVLETLL